MDRTGKLLLPAGRAQVEVRVGADLVEVSSIEQSVLGFGRRYLDRVYTPAELSYCEAGGTEMAERLSARFAAKEATLKVLRPRGFWLDWRQIEVVKATGDWCEIRTYGQAERLRRLAGITGFSVSLSHEHGYALAMVVATIEPRKARPRRRRDLHSIGRFRRGNL